MEFDKAWAAMEKQWRDQLTTTEQEKFAKLSTPNEREAFRVVRNWSRHEPSSSDFRIVAESLARRLGVSTQTACNIRRSFCNAGILQLSAPYVPRILSARYVWLLHEATGASPPTSPLPMDATTNNLTIREKPQHVRQTSLFVT